jgi:hypothetical protein
LYLVEGHKLSAVKEIFNFRSSKDEESDHIWTTLKATINAGAPDSDGTKALFHSFWDDNIRKIITLIDIPNKIIRDSNRGTSPQSLRLDFGILLQGVCVFRGE